MNKRGKEIMEHLETIMFITEEYMTRKDEK